MATCFVLFPTLTHTLMTPYGIFNSTYFKMYYVFLINCIILALLQHVISVFASHFLLLMMLIWKERRNYHLHPNSDVYIPIFHPTNYMIFCCGDNVQHCSCSIPVGLPVVATSLSSRLQQSKPIGSPQALLWPYFITWWIKLIIVWAILCLQHAISPGGSGLVWCGWKYVVRHCSCSSNKTPKLPNVKKEKEKERLLQWAVIQEV